MDVDERSEIERQAEFRAEVLKDLASEKEAIKELGDRVSALEKTVTLGNGHPSLTSQVTEIKTKMDQFGKEVSELKTEMTKMDELVAGMAELNTKFSLNEKNKASWWQVVVTLIGVAAMLVGAPLVQHLFK